MNQQYHQPDIDGSEPDDYFEDSGADVPDECAEYIATRYKAWDEAGLRLERENAELWGAIENMVQWCSKRDEWWDESVVMYDLVQRKRKATPTTTALPSDPRAPGGIGYDGAPGPGPGE